MSSSHVFFNTKAKKRPGMFTKYIASEVGLKQKDLFIMHAQTQCAVSSQPRERTKSFLLVPLSHPCERPREAKHVFSDLLNSLDGIQPL
jgi:hypothetical protein